MRQYFLAFVGARQRKGQRTFPTYRQK